QQATKTGATLQIAGHRGTQTVGIGGRQLLAGRQHGLHQRPGGIRARQVGQDVSQGFSHVPSVADLVLLACPIAQLPLQHQASQSNNRPYLRRRSGRTLSSASSLASDNLPPEPCFSLPKNSGT